MPWPSREKTLNLLAGLLIPSGATMLFNVLGVELRNGHGAPIPSEAYDFALGCAFSMVGVAVAQTNRNKTVKIFMYFLITLLVLIGTDLVFRYRFVDNEISMILLSDVIALAGATLAIWE